MSKENFVTKRVFLSLHLILYMVFAVSISSAQEKGLNAKAQQEIIHLIRKEKLDLILPGAMRDNNVDMWIHVIRAGFSDPMALHFGSVSGYLIFTDRGGDRIERALFGSGGHPDFFDIFGSLDVERAIAGYDFGKQDPGVYNEITEFIAERDPKTIAINSSDWLAVADGISYTQYLKLEKILGQKYSARIVSAEAVITDFRVRRVQREIIAFANGAEIHRQILERALSREVITPGVTTLGDVGWWVQQRLYEKNLIRKDRGDGILLPRVLYSAKSEPIDPPDARWWIHHNDYVLQRGDFFTYDLGLKYLDYFATVFKRNAYIMREGETSVPRSIQYAFDKGLEAREIIRKNIKVGRTGGETFEIVVSAMEEAGYIHTPFTDVGTEDYKLIQKSLANTDRSGFSLDLNSQGINNGTATSGGTSVSVGPSVSPFRSDRDHLTFQENHLFSHEFQVHTNLPERPGFPISISISGNHVLTNRGVEFLHPPNEKILLIH